VRRLAGDWCVAAWFLALMLSVPACAQALPNAASAVQKIEDPGRFHAGDDLKWADPDFDDSDWEAAVLRKPWRDWSVTGVHQPQGWYRVRATVRPDRPIGLANGWVRGGAHVYVDGQLLVSTGTIEPGTVRRSEPIYIEVPRELTRDGEVVIATRVTSSGTPVGNGVLSNWIYGHAEAILSMHARHRQRIWEGSSGVVPALIGGGLIGLGLLHGLLWARRREPEQGLFALGAGLLGLTLVESSLLHMGEIALADPWVKTYYARQSWGYLALLLFVWYFFGVRARRAIWVTTVVLFMISILALFLPSDLEKSIRNLVSAVPALMGIALIVHGFWHRIPYARLITAGFLPITLIGGIVTTFDVAREFGYPSPPFWEYRDWTLLFGNACVLSTMSFALINRFADTRAQLERTWRATARFVPDQFLALLGRKRITEVQRGDSTSRDLTVMFCAIPGFNDVTHEWSPGQSFTFLNRFLEAMEPCVHENGGFIAQYLGDGFLALFPVGSSRPVDAAIALQETARALELEPGLVGVKLTIGLHTGPVMLGTVGSDTRLTTGQVSDVVNTSARVRGLTAHYGAPIVISEATRALIEDEGWALHELDAVVMKGKVEALRAFEVLSGEPDLILRRYKEAEMGSYGEGLAAFRAGELARARPLFARLADRWVAARLFVKRCDWFLAHGLPDDWDGVVRLTVK